MKRFAVIMAGGSGTRFWPKSSPTKPKQLLALTGKRSLLQMTVDRLTKIIPKKQVLIVATELLKAPIKSQIPGVKILAEPEGRNTMAAVCWSAWEIAKTDPSAVVAILPADAHIQDVPAFQSTLLSAFNIAETEDRIVCLGIQPTFPATGYGYIESGREIGSLGHTIARFVEKPDAKQAEDLFSSGRFLWNAGIFVFKVKTLIAEVKAHAPEFAKSFDKAVKSKSSLKKIYKSLPKVPFDMALMEKTDKGAVIGGRFGWNDLGSWTALEEVLKATGPEGLINSSGGSFSLDCSGLIVDASSKKFVALIGVKDLIIVETKDAILVCSKDRAQDIKKITSRP